MKFKVDQQALLSELSLAMGAVENRVTVPVTGLVQLKAANNFLVLTTTNIDFGIKSRVPIQELDAEGSFCVPAARLYDWLSKVPAGQLSVSANKRFSAKVGKSNCSIAIPEDVSFPELPAPGAHLVSVPADVIGPMFRRAAVVIPAFEEGAFNYAAANLTIAKDSIKVNATNGRRLSSCRHDMSLPVPATIQVLVAKKFATEVSRLSQKTKDGQVRIHHGKNHVYFGFGDRLIYSRSLSGTFPNLDRALAADNTQKVVSFDAAEAVASLLRVATFSDHDSRSVLFEANGQLKFSSKTDVGDGSESIDAEYSGEPISVELNAAWVIDGLRAIDGKAEMRIVSPRAPIEFRAAGDSSFRYVVAPMYK